MSTKTYEDLVKEFQSLCNELANRAVTAKEEHLRKQALLTAQNTTKHLCTAYEFAASQAWAHIELAGVVAASDLGIFHIFSKQERPMTVPELSNQSGAAELLALRILRFLTAHGLVDQVDSQSYKANRITMEYTKDHWIGLMRTLLFCTPAYTALPEHLRKIGYQNPVDPKASAWQLGLGTEETFWEWLKARPDQAFQFNNMLKMPRSGFEESLVDVYSFENLFEGSNANDILFVDVGGGFGQQCVDLRINFSPSRGRIILQDLPQVVKGRKLEDIEVEAHDMMQAQHIVGSYRLGLTENVRSANRVTNEGARAYYFRGVCHDHSDDICRTFLGQTKNAMNEQSRLLVHEALVSDMNPSEQITRRDLGMMAQFGAMERSESQMKHLLQSAGLKVIGRHSSGLSDWVITEAVL